MRFLRLVYIFGRVVVFSDGGLVVPGAIGKILFCLHVDVLERPS